MMKTAFLMESSGYSHTLDERKLEELGWKVSECELAKAEPKDLRFRDEKLIQ